MYMPELILGNVLVLFSNMKVAEAFSCQQFIVKGLVTCYNNCYFQKR
jgi:hypothetical protein